MIVRGFVICIILVLDILLLSSQELNSDYISVHKTDSITYVMDIEGYIENCWYNGSVVSQKNIKEGDDLKLSWDLPAPIQTEIYALGVSKDKGWYDVNKKEDGRTGYDAVMCWAAVCANMLQWWQDRYVERYGSLPANAITGVGQKYELALFELYQKDWDNSYGSEVYYGIPWYLSGEDRTQNAMYVAKPKAGGGYFADQWNEIQTQLGSDYIYSIESYYNWDNGYEGTEPPLEIFTNYVIEAIDSGIASLSVRAGYSVMHAITLWGYKLDENGLLSKVYVTDSDDLIDTPKAPRVQLMQEYPVEVRNGREVGIVGLSDGFTPITQIVLFKGNLSDK